MRNARNALFGLLVVATAAQAGFVDERSSTRLPAAESAAAATTAPAAPVAPAVAQVSGAFDHPGWQGRAPAGQPPRALASAIAALLPANHPSVAIQAPEDILDAQVAWPKEVSRLEALRAISADNALSFELVGGTLRITRASAPSASSPLAAAAQPGTSAGAPISARWEILPTDTRLATALERWAKQAGYSFRWDAERHALIEGAHTFLGTFEQAVRGALDTPGIALSAYPLESCIYPNNPPLLRITRKGEQAKDCPIAD